MKKIILAIIFCMLMYSNCLSVSYSKDLNARPSKEQLKKEFEQRLNLSKKQKEKAKILHEHAKDQIVPIIAKIELNKQEIEKLRRSNLSEHEINNKIDEYIRENKELEAKARAIRKENIKEFEKILNNKQKNELQIMKAEGRARFEKQHPTRSPFGTLGAPGLFPQKRFLPGSMDYIK